MDEEVVDEGWAQRRVVKGGERGKASFGRNSEGLSPWRLTK